jgi:hypothetical protein
VSPEETHEGAVAAANATRTGLRLPPLLQLMMTQRQPSSQLSQEPKYKEMQK